MKYTRVIEGSLTDIEPPKYYKRCFLCCRLTYNFYYSTQREDRKHIYKIFLCQPCQEFKNRISTAQYSNSIQNYIDATWGVDEDIQS